MKEITRTPVVLEMPKVRCVYHPLWVDLFTVNLWSAAITIKTTQRPDCKYITHLFCYLSWSNLLGNTCGETAEDYTSWVDLVTHLFRFYSYKRELQRTLTLWYRFWGCWCQPASEDIETNGRARLPLFSCQRITGCYNIAGGFDDFRSYRVEWQEEKLQDWKGDS